jgi:hypothetical protein
VGFRDVSIDGKQVVQFLFFDAQIVGVLLTWNYFASYAFDYFDARSRHGPHFVGIIRQQADLADAEVSQYCRGEPVIPIVRSEAEFLIRFDFVAAVVLKFSFAGRGESIFSIPLITENAKVAPSRGTMR